MYIGDQNGGHLIAVDAATGNARWVTRLDDHFAAIVTQSPIVADGKVYVGVASLEEALAAFIPRYVCCTFRGSMSAVDAATGAVLWKTYMAPPGYSGAAVWGSTAAVDLATRSLYVDTGNNYSVPPASKACKLAGGTPAECLSPDDHIDSIMSLDMDTRTPVPRSSTAPSTGATATTTAGSRASPDRGRSTHSRPAATETELARDMSALRSADMSLQETHTAAGPWKRSRQGGSRVCVRTAWRTILTMRITSCGWPRFDWT